MHYVTDTHGLIWYLTGDKKLGKKALNLFEKADEGGVTIIVPSIVLAEIIHVCEKKKAELKISQVLNKIKSSLNYVVYNLDLNTLEKVMTLKNISEIHDKIITATSLLTDSTLITKDEEIKNSCLVDTVW